MGPENSRGVFSWRASSRVTEALNDMRRHGVDWRQRNRVYAWEAANVRTQLRWCNPERYVTAHLGTDRITKIVESVSNIFGMEPPTWFWSDDMDFAYLGMAYPSQNSFVLNLDRPEGAAQVCTILHETLHCRPRKKGWSDVKHGRLFVRDYIAALSRVPVDQSDWDYNLRPRPNPAVRNMLLNSARKWGIDV